MAFTEVQVTLSCFHTWTCYLIPLKGESFKVLPLAEPGVGAWKPNKVVQTPPPPHLSFCNILSCGKQWDTPSTATYIKKENQWNCRLWPYLTLIGALVKYEQKKFQVAMHCV